MWNSYLFQHSRTKWTQKNGNSCISPLTWNKRDNSDVRNVACCRKCLFIWLRKLQQANDTRTRICGGSTIWRGNGVRVKKRERSKNSIIIIRKIAFICAHVERILSYGVWMPARCFRTKRERGGRKQSTKKQKTCDRLQHIRGKISQSLLLRIMSKLYTYAYTALAVRTIPESWVTLYTDTKKQHSKETW